MRGRKTRVAKAAARYERAWAKPHTELSAADIAFRIRYAFMCGADHERRQARKVCHPAAGQPQ